MRRRTFFKSVASNVALMLIPKWWRPALGQAPTGRAASLQDLAEAVLPESLGPKRTAATVEGFRQWIDGYPAGADAGYGYGYPKPTLLGPNPSLHYDDQLKRLDTAAAGGNFAGLSIQEKRAVVRSALMQVGVGEIPSRPNGHHVATDLMSYFYSSSDGKDFCYNAAIRESDCRGLATSGDRPPAVS